MEKETAFLLEVHGERTSGSRYWVGRMSEKKNLHHESSALEERTREVVISPPLKIFKTWLDKALCNFFSFETASKLGSRPYFGQMVGPGHLLHGI